MISKGFLKSSIVYTIGGALPMVGSIILLPFYTNYLNDLHFLQVGFYISISLLFQILFTFSLDTYFGVLYTQLHEHPHKQKSVIGTTSVLLLLLGAFWLIISSVFGSYILEKVFLKEYEMNFWPYGFYAILTAFFNSYFKTSTNCLIYLKKPELYLIFNVINLVATLAISICGLYLFPETIIGPMYGRLLSGVVIFVLAHYVFAKFGNFKLEREFMPELRRFCITFIIYVLSGWVLGQIDRFMLQSYIDKIDLNTYDLMLKCFFGIEFVQNSLSAVIFPKIYELWSKQETRSTSKETNRYFNVFTVVNIMQLILFCIAMPLLYDLLITKQSFHEASDYIGVLAAGYGLRSILNFYLSTILFTKNTQILLKIFGISALVQIFATYYSAKHWGLEGVIYTGIGTKLIQILLSNLFTKGIFNYEFNYFKIYVIPILYLVLNVVQFKLFPQYNMALYLLQFVVFGIIFFIVFRKEIKQVLVQFKLLKA